MWERIAFDRSATRQQDLRGEGALVYPEGNRLRPALAIPSHQAQKSGTLRDGYLGPRRGRYRREARVVRALLDRARAGVIFAGAGVAPVALWLPESPKRRHAAPPPCTLATLPIFTRFAEACFERARRAMARGALRGG